MHWSVYFDENFISESSFQISCSSLWHVDVVASVISRLRNCKLIFLESRVRLKALTLKKVANCFCFGLDQYHSFIHNSFTWFSLSLVKSDLNHNVKTGFHVDLECVCLPST